ncbi:MAG: putative ABC transporter permease [Clostridia bacterium]|nr:putative ABC transporter permease [Clostridia bacterium]
MKGEKNKITAPRGAKDERCSLSVASLAFFIISILGWAYETTFMLLLHGRFFDRGFLSLPLCPIYGAPVCLLYLVFGTPIRGRYGEAVSNAAQKRAWGKAWAFVVRYGGYFLLSGAFATLLELAVGLLFQSFGVSLWSYADQPMNFHGVVCLSVSLFWGLLLTLFMRFPMPWLIGLLTRIPRKIRWIANAVLWSLLLCDFIFNSLYLIKNGEQYDLKRFFYAK